MCVRKSLLEIYALAVCFVTVVCFVIALGIGLYDLVELTNPEFTLRSHAYERHRSNEAFVRNWAKDKKLPPEAEVTKLREESYREELRTEQRSALQSLVQILIVLIIDVVLFFVHWRLAKRARELLPTT
jgi:hypothetical protein